MQPYARNLLKIAAFCFVSFTVLAGSQEFQNLSSGTATWSGSQTSVNLSIEITTQKTVPMQGTSGSFGYAAMTNGLHDVLVLATHQPIIDSTHVNHPSGFHTHVLDMMPPTTSCPNATYEIDLQNSKLNTGFDLNYKWVIKGKHITIKDVPLSHLAGPGVSSIFSFQISEVIDSNNNKEVHRCITVIDKIP